MFGFLRRRRPKPAQGPTIPLTAHVTSHVEPAFRSALYERPLARVLGARGMLTGGGSMFGEGGEILYANIGMRVESLSDDLLDAIVDTLERAEAPVGSYLCTGDETVLRRFGTAEVVALDLDARNLPREVYETCTVDELVAEIAPGMADKGVYQGLHLTRERGILYFHGRDVAGMEAAIRTVAADHPLCQGAALRRPATA
jgi:hypothetical protein